MDIYLERVVLKLTKLLSLKVFLELEVEEGGGGPQAPGGGRSCCGRT